MRAVRRANAARSASGGSNDWVSDECRVELRTASRGLPTRAWHLPFSLCVRLVPAAGGLQFGGSNYWLRLADPIGFCDCNEPAPPRVHHSRHAAEREDCPD